MIQKSEKNSCAGRFIGRKLAKRRPVISNPRPANPVFLHGRKWKHVIVTIPHVEDPPIPPIRRKRKHIKAEVDLKALKKCSKMTFFEIMSAIQLRRCLRALRTSINVVDEGEVERKKLGDLFFSFFGKETAIMVFTSMPFNIDCSQSRSLTNELNDSFFDNANVCGYGGYGSYGFKKFLLLEPPKRDLDKLKFCKICRPTTKFYSQSINAVKYFQIRNEKTQQRNVCILMFRNASTNEYSSKQSMAEECRTNVKNISYKTNRKRNKAYRLRGSYIEKVWNNMRKNFTKNKATFTERSEVSAKLKNHENATLEPIRHFCIDDAVHSTQVYTVQRYSDHEDEDFHRNFLIQNSASSIQPAYAELQPKFLKMNGDSDRDSVSSFTDSLNEFCYSL